MIDHRAPGGVERRVALECRAVGRRLVGHAAVFNSIADIGAFREVIKPGAFRANLLSGSDIMALVDHDPTRLLGRTKSGTLRLSEDARGLAFEIDLPETQLGRDVLALAERGDLGGMSFGFTAVDQAWPTRGTRELRAVQLHEISVVQAKAAYSATSVSARSQAAFVYAEAVRRALLLRCLL
jgi:HK97 family phage prohead protease